MVDSGYVRINSHPSSNLRLANYSEKTQFERRWNEVTLNCRGLVFDDNYEIVARPFAKFFNFGERPLEFSTDDPVEVTDKMDGSLGILFWNDEEAEYQIATRGSFNSDQAIHATEVWNRKYPFATPLEGYTFLFEIIYPANRIVLNYGELDDLVLLGAVEHSRGIVYGPNEAAGMMDWNGPKAKVFEYRTLNDCFGVHRANAEGLVIRSGTKMVKMKQEDYVTLHKLVTGLNERAVWERLKKGESAASICEQLPDEFHDWVVDTAQDLFVKFFEKEQEILGAYIDVITSLPGGFTQKDFALKAVKTPYSSYLFKLLKCESVDDMIWETLKPSVDKS